MTQVGQGKVGWAKAEPRHWDFWPPIWSHADGLSDLDGRILRAAFNPPRDSRNVAGFYDARENLFPPLSNV